MRVAGIVFWIVFVISLALLATGCSTADTEYEFGFGTTEVFGVVDLGQDDPEDADAIVVVLKNHDMFIPLDRRDEISGIEYQGFTRNITHPTAHVIPVSREGAFTIQIPSNVVSVDIMFIARNKLTRRVQFRRSAVIGRIKYRPTLVSMPDWRNHFYTYLEPQLQEYIVEPRYQLSRSEQRILGDWLTHQKNNLETGRHQG